MVPLPSAATEVAVAVAIASAPIKLVPTLLPPQSEPAAAGAPPVATTAATAEPLLLARALPVVGKEGRRVVLTSSPAPAAPVVLARMQAALVAAALRRGPLAPAAGEREAPTAQVIMERTRRRLRLALAAQAMRAMGALPVLLLGVREETVLNTQARPRMEVEEEAAAGKAALTLEAAALTVVAAAAAAIPASRWVLPARPASSS